ncbi:MAG TPA: outer membrane protein assembly factor BamD [Caulobacteraceae bacterium]|nr:outer membrane protein assembly factor BamD [Caulobacteraceae bacterium]
MVGNLKGRAAVVLILVASVAIGGCGMLHKKKPELAYQERPVELLFSTGADKLDHHQWNDAVNYFREVERQHPYSEWSRRAILMTAYAHYEANSYAEAIADADRFISLYPGNASTPYAYYLKAICYFEQIVDVGRDQASTGDAQNALREVIKRYPATEYATDARLKMDMTSDQLAGKEMTIGRYYLRNNDPIAAIGRFRNVVEKYQTTSHTAEALYRLVEAYLTLGLTAEAAKNGAVLGFNYPGDLWYRDAYRLLTSKGLRPAVEPDASGARSRSLPLFGHHKDTTLAPPAVDATVASAGAPRSAAPVAADDKKPAKKDGLVHGVLGL